MALPHQPNDHQKPGITPNLSHAWPPYYAPPIPFPKCLFTQITEYNTTSWHMGHGLWSNWEPWKLRGGADPGVRRGLEELTPTLSPLLETSPTLSLGVVGSWRKDSCWIREERWQGHSEPVWSCLVQEPTREKEESGFHSFIFRVVHT